MVHLVGLRILVTLAVVHGTFSQRIATASSQLAYQNLQRSSFMENVKLSSYGPQMQLPAQQPETAETRIVKYPDEKIVHHPSPIYVKRPPTFVTINHPDIVIEPNPVVYHKPAAVVRSPIIYKHLPQKVQHRHVVKHIVKPIERKIVLEEKRLPQMFIRKTIPNQPFISKAYYVAQPTDGTVEAAENVPCQQYIRPPRNPVYQPEATSEFTVPNGQATDSARIYYKQSFPSTFQK